MVAQVTGELESHGRAGARFRGRASGGKSLSFGVYLVGIVFTLAAGTPLFSIRDSGWLHATTCVGQASKFREALCIE